MKAFQFVESQKPAELREVPVPEPGPGQVLIKIGGAGACHSDLHILEAPAKTPGPARSPSPSAMRMRAGSRSWGPARPDSRWETR